MSSTPAVARYRPQVPPDMSKMNAAEKKARREQLRALMFNNRNDEFCVRYAGELNGSAFQVQKSNNAQLYLHDYAAQTTVDQISNTQLVLGPNKSSVFLRNCTDCTFVIFC